MAKLGADRNLFGMRLASNVRTSHSPKSEILSGFGLRVCFALVVRPFGGLRRGCLFCRSAEQGTITISYRFQSNHGGSSSRQTVRMPVQEVMENGHVKRQAVSQKSPRVELGPLRRWLDV